MKLVMENAKAVWDKSLPVELSWYWKMLRALNRLYTKHKTTSTMVAMKAGCTFILLYVEGSNQNVLCT